MTSSNSPDNNRNSREFNPFDTPPGGISLRGLDLYDDDCPDSSLTEEMDRLFEAPNLVGVDSSGDNTAPVDYKAETLRNLSGRDLEPTVFVPSNSIANQSRVGVRDGALALVQGTELATQADESAASSAEENAGLQTGQFPTDTGKTIDFDPAGLSLVELARSAAFAKIGAKILVRVGGPTVQFAVVEVVDVKGLNIGVSLDGGQIKHIPADILASMNSINEIDTEHVEAFFTMGDTVRLKLKKGSIVENLKVNQILPTGIWLVDEHGNGYVVLSHQVDTFMSLNLDKIKVTKTESTTLGLSGSGTISYSLRNGKTPERLIGGSEAVRMYMASCEDDSQVFQTFLGFLEAQVERTVAHSDLVDVIKNAAINYPDINQINYCSLHIGENRIGEKGLSVMNMGGYKVVLINTRTHSLASINYPDDVFDSSTDGRPGIGLAHVSSDNLVCAFSPNIARYCTNELILFLSKNLDGNEASMRKTLQVFLKEKLKNDGKPDTSFSFVLRRP